MSVGNPAGHDQHDNYCCRFQPILMQEKTLGTLRDRQLTLFRFRRSVCCGRMSLLLSPSSAGKACSSSSWAAWDIASATNPAIN